MASRCRGYLPLRTAGPFPPCITETGPGPANQSSTPTGQWPTSGCKYKYGILTGAQPCCHSGPSPATRGFGCSCLRVDTTARILQPQQRSHAAATSEASGCRDANGVVRTAWAHTRQLGAHRQWEWHRNERSRRSHDRGCHWRKDALPVDRDTPVAE